MRYLIDSNVIISILDDDPAAKHLLEILSGAEKFISVIAYMEVQHGVLKQGPSSVDRFSRLLQQLPILEVSQDIAHRCAELRVRLEKPGRKVRPRTLDLLIASTALEFDLMVVTSNVHDFEDIPGLKVYQPLETD